MAVQILFHTRALSIAGRLDPFFWFLYANMWTDITGTYTLEGIRFN